MSRYIDADHAEFRLQCCGIYHGVIAFDTVKAVLNDAPSIDIEPKRGRWKMETAETIYGKAYLLTCSECGETVSVTEIGLPYEHFCRNCGADMRGKDDE